MIRLCRVVTFGTFPISLSQNIRNGYTTLRPGRDVQLRERHRLEDAAETGEHPQPAGAVRPAAGAAPGLGPVQGPRAVRGPRERVSVLRRAARLFFGE